jgi:hypothetical protein
MFGLYRGLNEGCLHLRDLSVLDAPVGKTLLPHRLPCTNAGHMKVSTTEVKDK